MSFKFGNSSLARLEQCDPRLQQIMHAAIQNSVIDFGITEGHRDEATQNKYFEEGKSRLKYPKGAHNSFPSTAVDIVAYIHGKPTYNLGYYQYFYGLFTGIAHAMYRDVSIRSGLDWDMDGEMITDQTLQDGCHFELAKRKR